MKHKKHLMNILTAVLLIACILTSSAYAYTHAAKTKINTYTISDSHHVYYNIYKHYADGSITSQSGIDMGLVWTGDSIDTEKLEHLRNIDWTNINNKIYSSHPATMGSSNVTITVHGYEEQSIQWLANAAVLMGDNPAYTVYFKVGNTSSSAMFETVTSEHAFDDKYYKFDETKLVSGYQFLGWHLATASEAGYGGSPAAPDLSLARVDIEAVHNGAEVTGYRVNTDIWTNGTINFNSYLDSSVGYNKIVAYPIVIQTS